MPLERVYLIGPELVRYDYSQVVVFDDSESRPGSLWIDDHWNQGFARREKTVCFLTIRQTGKASLAVYLGRVEDPRGWERAIAVPLQVPSGVLHIEGPGEYPIQRIVNVEPGTYVVTFAQRVGEKDELSFDVFLDKKTETRSRVLKADGTLKVPQTLLETADPA